MNLFRFRLIFSFLLITSLLFAGCTQNASPAPVTEKEATNEDRVVQHAMGETKVPAHPKRVVVLDNGALDNLLALGVKPVGAPTVFENEPFFSYLKEQTQGIQQVGIIDQPNLEAVAAAKPDLILGVKEMHEKVYDKLSQIAPTVFTEEIGMDWKGNLKLHAEAVGKNKEADELIQQYDGRVAELQKKLGDRLKTTQISLLRPRADHIRVYLRQSFSGKLIEDLGFARPPVQTKDDFALKVTEENIQDLDGDVIIWFSRDKENLLKDKVMKSPLWSQLKAVKQNQVYEVSAETWLSGMGVQAANLMLDDVNKMFDK